MCLSPFDIPGCLIGRPFPVCIFAVSKKKKERKGRKRKLYLLYKVGNKRKLRNGHFLLQCQIQNTSESVGFSFRGKKPTGRSATRRSGSEKSREQNTKSKRRASLGVLHQWLVSRTTWLLLKRSRGKIQWKWQKAAMSTNLVDDVVAWRTKEGMSSYLEHSLFLFVVFSSDLQQNDHVKEECYG